MPEQPQLVHLNVEKQRLYSELLPDDPASHPVPQGEPGHPAKETHFGCLYPQHYSFINDPIGSVPASSPICQ